MTGTSRALPCPAAQSTCGAGLAQWRQARLTEARGILREAGDHPATLVMLAAQVVAHQSDAAAERADARDLLRLHDPRPLNPAAAPPLPHGGAA